MRGGYARRGLRFGWRLALAVVLALALLVLVTFAGEARAWAERILFQIEHVPPRDIALAFAFKGLESLLVALAWRNILRAVFPEQRVAYRQVIGAYQGSVAIGVVTPGQTATIALLGLLRLALPGASIPALLASTVVQGLGFALIGVTVWVLLALAYPDIVRQSEGIVLSAYGTLAHHRSLTLAAAALILLLLAFAALALRRRLRVWREQVRPAAAILAHPARYAGGVFLPELASYGCRWVVTASLLAAFGIPVTAKSLLLAVAARSVSGSLTITPGGIGNATLLSVVVLQPYADSWTIIGWSISQDVLMAAFNLALGVVAILWGLGWSRARRLLRHPLGHQPPAAPAAATLPGHVGPSPGIEPAARD